MPYMVRNPDPNELLPDIREGVNDYYTLRELEGAVHIDSPRGKDDEEFLHEEYFRLTDGRIVCLFSIDLDYPNDNNFTLKALQRNEQ